ncbi:MAG: S41 family peptidase [Eubacteriales bacterium]|nr:S41 family peptidase [Eubacteriales bacterium]
MDYENMTDEWPKKKRKEAAYTRGVMTGIIAGVFAVLAVVCTAFGVAFNLGYIHIGINGEVYVQGDAATDSRGVGSNVEGKLNALDSLMDYFYFDNVDEELAQSNIYKAYLASYGDKYTVYYTPEEYKALVESTTGTFYGIGAVCQKHEDGTIKIIDAYEEAPAFKAGIRTGDFISKVNGTDIRDMDLSSAVALIKGDIGTTVELEVIREEKHFNVMVTRDKVSTQTVKYELKENGIGYVAISQFEEVTTNQFKMAVEDLMAQGMKGLIVDIRSNPGGMLTTVVDMLDYILPDGLIVYTEDKNGKRTEYSGKNSAELTVPMAVLVNGDSASASEIFAGALQDYGKGRIIGTQTFGKGIVQTIKPLTDGSAVKFTIAKYFTPKGQDIHGKGVMPDEMVELNSDAEGDEQLNAALNYLNNQIN